MATSMQPYLRRWDARAASSCQRYLANSSLVATRVRAAYGIDATVVPPPTSFDPAGPCEEVPGLTPGFFLTVGRLVAHKNTDAVVSAFASMPAHQLVVVGDGPERPRLTAGARHNVRFTGRVTDQQLRWLYAHCTALVSASREDYGLTPLEAASFGKPSALLRFGGALDTMVEDETATFFDDPSPRRVSAAVRDAVRKPWEPARIRANADRFSTPRFEARLRAIVAEELREAR